MVGRNRLSQKFFHRPWRDKCQDGPGWPSPVPGCMLPRRRGYEICTRDVSLQLYLGVRVSTLTLPVLARAKKNVSDSARRIPGRHRQSRVTVRTTLYELTF